MELDWVWQPLVDENGTIPHQQLENILLEVAR